jgi:hypothetical protein
VVTYEIGDQRHLDAGNLIQPGADGFKKPVGLKPVLSESVGGEKGFSVLNVFLF